MVQVKFKSLRSRDADVITQFGAKGQRSWSSDIGGQEKIAPVFQCENRGWVMKRRTDENTEEREIDSKLIKGKLERKCRYIPHLSLLYSPSD